MTDYRFDAVQTRNALVAGIRDIAARLAGRR